MNGKLRDWCVIGKGKQRRIGTRRTEQYKLGDHIFYASNRGLLRMKDDLPIIMLKQQVKWDCLRKSRTYGHSKYKSWSLEKECYSLWIKSKKKGGRLHLGDTVYQLRMCHPYSKLEICLTSQWCWEFWLLFIWFYSIYSGFYSYDSIPWS